MKTDKQTPTQFNLSEKINTAPRLNGGEDILLDIDVEDVKEFIRLLKEEFCCCIGFGNSCYTCNFCRKINQIAGDKLIERGY